jgi:alpha-L-rhamnosidase
MEQGLTTLSENWRNTDSLNHIMFGDVSNWMIQWITGIGLDKTSPGFANILIQPQPVEGLTWARAFHDSPLGRINVEWRKDGGAFHLALRVPANATATVSLPVSPAQSVTEGGKPIGTVTGIRSAGQADGRSVYLIGSGDYEFSVV